MDWGDAHGRATRRSTSCGWPAACRRPRRRTLIAAWALRWRLAVPGSDPQRAAELMRPVAAPARQPPRTPDFLASIEPAEHPYHAADVPDRLTAAAQLAIP